MSRRELGALVALVLFAVALVAGFVLVVDVALRDADRRVSPPSQAPAATWSPHPAPPSRPPLGPWGDQHGVELDSP